MGSLSAKNASEKFSRLGTSKDFSKDTVKKVTSEGIKYD
jgi:hypothetical protein